MAVKRLGAALLFVPLLTHAAPNLYADPYPSTAVQPDTVTFTINGGAPQPCTLEAVAGGKQPKCDLAGITTAGTYTLIMTVTRAAGCLNNTCWDAGSASSAPFTYVWAANVVSPPAGIAVRP